MSNLLPQEKEALQKFVSYLEESIPEKTKNISLFGSKARGDSQKDSDIDILIILDKDNRQLRRTIITKAARISLEYDVLLSPRIIGAERWTEMRGFSLYRNVIKEANSLGIVKGNLQLRSTKTALNFG